MARRNALVLIGFLSAKSFLAQAGVPQGDDYCRSDALAGPDEGAEVYARRGDYCDGAVFQVNAGNGELPVIGVSATPIQGNPKFQAVSIAAMALPSSVSGISWPLHVQGVAKSPEANYRLDAALSPVRPLVLGSESAMSKVAPRLRAEDVAWISWSDSSVDGLTYIPVIAPGSIAGKVEVTVRPTIPVAYVIFTVEDTRGAVIHPKANVKMESNPEGRALPMTFVIPAGEPELVVVRVTAFGNSGRTQVARFRLVRPKGAKH